MSQPTGESNILFGLGGSPRIPVTKQKIYT